MINLIIRYMYCGFAAIGAFTVISNLASSLVTSTDCACIFLATFFISLLLNFLDKR